MHEGTVSQGGRVFTGGGQLSREKTPALGTSQVRELKTKYAHDPSYTF